MVARQHYIELRKERIPALNSFYSKFVVVFRQGGSFGQIIEQLYERYVAAPARSELEVMRQPEKAEKEVVAA